MLNVYLTNNSVVPSGCSLAFRSHNKTFFIDEKTGRFFASTWIDENGNVSGYTVTPATSLYMDDDGSFAILVNCK
jgi:hypothetical protein